MQQRRENPAIGLYRQHQVVEYAQRGEDRRSLEFAPDAQIDDFILGELA